ncbi:RING-H2 finger protein ATL1-like, partial [Curcuma longa]|uniref:RING-H2 finger protein ATL1-like n=1 Tax=Curcuma longa TaxID=136217 RepID=UPI003D9FB127
NIPILVVTIVGVLLAAILVLGYYFFAARCCFWRRRSDALDRSQRRLRDDLMMFAVESRGLGQSEIRQIPTFRYRKETDGSAGGGDCAVCLGEFQEEETVRLLPDCFHVFHVDCIDTWLQSNANCPLCRASITPEAAAVPVDKLPAFLRSSRGLQGTRSGDVAIDVRDDKPEVDLRRQLRRHGSTGARRLPPEAPPMRRSFSVDTAVADRRLYGEVQKIVSQNPHFREAATSIGRGGEGSSGAARVRWGLFPFHRRSSSAAAFS